MAASTLGSRLRIALKGKTPAAFAREAGSTEATISNWLNDNVQVDHVKAEQLFRIADAAHLNARFLLTGKAGPERFNAEDQDTAYQSQPVQWELVTIAVQLVTEDLAKKGVELSPPKRSEAIQVAYELLTEGMPRAKVLRFVQTMAA